MGKFKNMTNKQMLEYIWDYYKLHIGGAILFLSIAFSLIYGQVTKIDYIFNITIISSGLVEETRIDIENKTNSILINDDDVNKKTQVSYIPLNNPNDKGLELTYKLIAKLTAGDIDIIIADKDQVETLIEKEAFIDINSINGLNEDSSYDYLSDSTNRVYGISLESSKILKDINYNIQNKFVGIASSSKNITEAIEVIKYLLHGDI